MNERIAFEAQLARIHESCGTSNLTELAVLMQARMPELTDAKRREKIPAAWLIFLLRSNGANPEWILSGCGPRRLGPLSPGATHTYADAQTERERLDKLEALRSFSARELAEELLRRIASTKCF